VQEIAPGVVRVAVAPELRLSLHHDCAVAAGVPGRGEAVQRIVSEALVARGALLLVMPQTLPLSVPVVPFPRWKS
jgi:hypothetical protein